MSNSSETTAKAVELEAGAVAATVAAVPTIEDDHEAVNDLVLVESKDFAQVVFADVHDEYSENATCECEFTLNELLAADETDWIGVYKVGFSSHRDFVCKVPVDLAMIVNNHGKVTFPADKLPKDDGEFYQFVYVSQSKQMRGASVPFQFKKARLSDYIEIEEQEAIIYKSKESAINDTLSEIKSRCIHLTQANDTYERLIKENEELIACLRAELNAMKRRCLDLTLDNEKINNTLKNKVEVFVNMTETIGNLTTENARLQTKFESLSAENRDLVDSLQTRIDQVAQLKAELENLKMDQIVKLERQVDERVEELTKIRLELKRNEAIVVEQAITIQNILAERDNLHTIIDKLSKEKNALECNQENLFQELSMSRDKLMAAEECKEILRGQLVSLTEELERAQKKLAQQADEIESMQGRQLATDAQREASFEKMREENAALRQDLEQSNGAYYALRLAHSHLESRLKTSEASRVKQEKELHITLNKQREEIEELKERIKAGAKEYSKLFDKYRLVRNQQLNMDVNVYHNLNGDVVPLGRSNNNNPAATTPNNNVLFERFFNSSMLSNNESRDQFDSDSAIQDKSATTTGMNTPVLRAFDLDSNNGKSDAQSSSTKEEEERLWIELETSAAAARFKAPPVQLLKPAQTTPIVAAAAAAAPVLASKSSPSSSPNSFQSAATATTGSPTIVPGLLSPIAKLAENISDDGLLNAAAARSSSEKSSLSALEEAEKFQPEKIESERVPSSAGVLRVEIKKKSIINETSSNCDICHYIFPSNSTVDDIEKHYQIHFGPTCPVCFMTFRKGYPQKDYESHVQSHFNSSD